MQVEAHYQNCNLNDFENDGKLMILELIYGGPIPACDYGQKWCVWIMLTEDLGHDQKIKCKTKING